MLNPRSDITGSGVVEAATKALTEEMGARLARKKATARELPSGLDASQVMSAHILHILSALYEEYSILKMCPNILLGMR